MLHNRISVTRCHLGLGKRYVLVEAEKGEIENKEGLITEHVPKLCQVVSTCSRTQSSIAFHDVLAFMLEPKVENTNHGMALPHHPLWSILYRLSRLSD